MATATSRASSRGTEEYCEPALVLPTFAHVQHPRPAAGASEPFRTSDQHRHESTSSLLTGKFDKGLDSDGQEVADEKPNNRREIDMHKSVGKPDVTDQLLGMPLPVPTLRNNLETYLSWKLQKMTASQEAKMPLSNDNIRDMASDLLHSKHPYRYTGNKQQWRRRASKGSNSNAGNRNGPRA